MQKLNESVHRLVKVIKDINAVEKVELESYTEDVKMVKVKDE